MSELSARFRQSPSEVRRYVIDYTLELQPSEEVSSVGVTVTSPTGELSPTLVIASISIVSGGLQVYFFASVGTAGQTYEAAFLATTSIGQVFEDVVEFNIQVPT